MFSVAMVSRALGLPVVTVDVVERFPASSADVVRLRILLSDGRDRTVVGKYATGEGAVAVRREVRFFAELASQWDHPAPRLLGVHDSGDSGVLLLVEDLDAAGYRLVGGEVSEDQLQGAIETLVGLHARFWDRVPFELVDAANPSPSATRTAQAWPPEVITKHAETVRTESEKFFAEAVDLTAGERRLIDEILPAWERQFLARTSGGRSITLIHGDYHFFGNVFFAPGVAQPRVIDWSELKPGLGPHDLAYCLVALPLEERPARDRVLLRQYWDALRKGGVGRYSWELCEWDYRFSMISNLFQSVFQHSEQWYRKSLNAIDALDSRTVLTEPPPAG